jgi:hypothetical protein
MIFSIQQLSDESKLSHALRFEVLEQLCPPELVSDLLSRCHAYKASQALAQCVGLCCKNAGDVVLVCHTTFATGKRRWYP